MSEEQKSTLHRAAQRTAWAARALNAAADDAKAAGASAAADVLWDEGQRLGQLAAEVRKLPDGGGMSVDPRFFPHGDDFRGRRVHQTRLQGGDASSDSYCFVD